MASDAESSDTASSEEIIDESMQSDFPIMSKEAQRKTNGARLVAGIRREIARALNIIRTYRKNSLKRSRYESEWPNSEGPALQKQFEGELTQSQSMEQVDNTDFDRFTRRLDRRVGALEKRKEFSRSYARAAVVVFQFGCCSYCGEPLPHEFDLDHIDQNPSNNDILNCAAACPGCHDRKSVAFMNRYDFILRPMMYRCYVLRRHFQQLWRQKSWKNEYLTSFGMTNLQVASMSVSKVETAFLSLKAAPLSVPAVWQADDNVNAVPVPLRNKSDEVTMESKSQSDIDRCTFFSRLSDVFSKPSLLQKQFGDTMYAAKTIISRPVQPGFSNRFSQFWRVTYTDGDAEDYTLEDFARHMTTCDVTIKAGSLLLKTASVGQESYVLVVMKKLGPDVWCKDEFGSVLGPITVSRAERWRRFWLCNKTVYDKHLFSGTKIGDFASFRRSIVLDSPAKAAANAASAAIFAAFYARKVAEKAIVAAEAASRSIAVEQESQDYGVSVAQNKAKRTSNPRKMLRF